MHPCLHPVSPATTCVCVGVQNLLSALRCTVLRWVGLCSTPPLPYSICLKDVSTGTPKVRKREGRALAPLSPAAVSSGAGPFRLGKPLGSEGRVFDRPPLECQNAAVSAHMLCLASPSCQEEDAKKSERGPSRWELLTNDFKIPRCLIGRDLGNGKRAEAINLLLMWVPGAKVSFYAKKKNFLLDPKMIPRFRFGDSSALYWATSQAFLKARDKPLLL